MEKRAQLAALSGSPKVPSAHHVTVSEEPHKLLSKPEGKSGAGT